MKKSIQIAPVGFEYKRILAGLKFIPSNTIYLLKSNITQKNKFDKALVKISENFTLRLNEHLEQSKTYNIKIKECSFINYKTIIKRLSHILREIFDQAREQNLKHEISINLGTSTKLFSSAAMFVSSFFVEDVKLFYINAKKYTINLLLDQSRKKDEILETYKKEGITFSDDDLTEYHCVEVPVVKAELCSDKCKFIIQAMNRLSDDLTEKWIKLDDILEEIGLIPNHSTKMRFRYHFRYLLERNLIEQYKHGKLRTYRFTEMGEILAIIISELDEYFPIK